MADWLSSLAGVVVDASLRACAVAAVIAVLLAAGKVRTSAAVHAAWCFVVCTMLLMPVLPHWAPAFPIVPVPEIPSIEVALVPPAGPVPEIPPLQAGTAGAPIAAAAQTRSTRSVSPEPPPATRFWPVIAVSIYLAGVLINAVRLVAGGRRAATLARSARRTESWHAVYESRDVAAPVTIGVIRPRIVLPSDWRAWPPDKLRAVIAHEQAHVARRDPLWQFVARCNRAIFWFHPLAWWLERKVAAKAEEACDDAAVQVLGQRRRYAEVLLDMADAVRRSNGLLRGQSIGVGGSGLLGRRIDRILAGATGNPVSRRRRWSLSAVGIVAVLAIVACREEATPLLPDPELTRSMADQQYEEQLWKAAEALTKEQAETLERAVAANPKDFDTRKKLLIFYRVSGQKVLGWNEMIARRRPHLLWLIEHYPASRLTVEANFLSPVHDPESYAAARQLWLQHVASRDVGVRTLSQAAGFFSNHEKQLAEEILLRAAALDPEGRSLVRERFGVYEPPWPVRLGTLYARAIVGSTDQTTQSIPAGGGSDPFAAEARRKLDSSDDARVLAAAGSYLSRVRDPKRSLDTNALAREYLERALELQPDLASAKGSLLQMDLSARQRALREKLRQQKSLPDVERIDYLLGTIDETYMRGEAAEYYGAQDEAKLTVWGDPRAAFDKTRDDAQELLALAARYPDHPRYGTAIYRGNIALATLALRDGDRALAVSYMREAAKSPGSDELTYLSDSMLRLRLVNYLLKYGERESVADFLDRVAQLTLNQRDYLKADAEAIRSGRMPRSYQHMVARGE
jgi:beta-lactamase regulating signal transducer with metallopeptidase domain